MVRIGQKVCCTHWLWFPFFAALVFGSQGSIVSLPYHWDEVIVYYNPLRVILDRGLIAALLDPATFLFHPPGMQLLALPFYWVLGDQPVVGRIFSGLMTSAGLYFTFLIGRRHFHWVFGLLSALLLFSSMRVFPHALQFHADGVLFGLGTAYVYAGITNRFIFAIGLGLVCGLVRETALAFGVALGIFYLVERAWNSNRRQKILVTVAPFISLGSTFVAHRLLTGKFFNHAAFTEGHLSLGSKFFLGLHRVLPDLMSGWIFFPKWSGSKDFEVYLAVLFCAVFLARQIFRRETGSTAEWAFLSVFSIFMLFFAFNSGFLQRYLLPAYPYWVLFFLSQAWCISRRGTALLVFAALFTNPKYHYEVRAGHSSEQPNAFEFSMDYSDMIRLHQKMANHINANVPAGSKVATGWPFSSIFLYPMYGYVKNEMLDISVNNLTQDADYIIDGSCLPVAERNKFKDKLSLFEKVHEFSRPGMWVALYKNKVGKSSGNRAL